MNSEYLAGVLVRGPEAEDGLEPRCSLINRSSDQNLDHLYTNIDVVTSLGVYTRNTMFTKEYPVTQYSQTDT